MVNLTIFYGYQLPADEFDKQVYYQTTEKKYSCEHIEDSKCPTEDSYCIECGEEIVVEEVETKAVKSEFKCLSHLKIIREDGERKNVYLTTNVVETDSREIDNEPIDVEDDNSLVGKAIASYFPNLFSKSKHGLWMLPEVVITEFT